MSQKPAPALFSDIFQFSKNLRDMTHIQTSDLKYITFQRDCFAAICLYQIGLPPQELLTLSFVELNKLVPPSWLSWLHTFQKQLQIPSPWFHTARHDSKRQGLSRRSLELSLKKQAAENQLKNWSVLGLKHAHICKLLQQGLSETQIRINLKLSNNFKFQPFLKYLHKVESEQVYADIHIS